MSDTKTQIISIGSDPQQSLLREQTLKIEQEIVQEDTQPISKLTKKIVEEIKDHRTIHEVNQYASYFPAFYKREIRIAKSAFIFWTIIGVLIILGVFAVLGLTIYNWQHDKIHEASPWWCLFFIPLVVILVVVWCIFVARYFNYRSEAKTVNFKDEKKVTINVVKTYRNLKTNHIDVNWFSFTFYLLLLLAILIDLLCCYFITAKDKQNFITFVNAVIINNHSSDQLLPYQIVFWIGVVSIFLIVVNHIISITYTTFRIASIDNFYNVMIVPQEEIDTLKKQRNKRDLIICLCFLAVVGLLIYLIVRIVKRSKSTTVVVK